MYYCVLILENTKWYMALLESDNTHENIKGYKGNKEICFIHCFPKLFDLRAIISLNTYENLV